MQKKLYDLSKLKETVCVPTTISLPVGWKNKILENYWNYKEIVALGIKAKEENPQLISRIRELEESNKRLVSKLSAVSQKLYLMGGDPNAL